MSLSRNHRNAASGVLPARTLRARRQWRWTCATAPYEQRGALPGGRREAAAVAEVAAGAEPVPREGASVVAVLLPPGHAQRRSRSNESRALAGTTIAAASVILAATTPSRAPDGRSRAASSAASAAAPS